MIAQKPAATTPADPRRVFLILPFIFLSLWFRLEEFSHSHPALLAGWIVLFFALVPVLWRCMIGRPRTILMMLWLLISGVVLLDFLQRLSYEDFSRSRFEKQARESSDEVRERAGKLVEGLEAESVKLEKALRAVDTSLPEAVPIGVIASLGTSKFWWGVYNEEGRLLAWNGEMPGSETYLQEGSREVSVEGILHQQFLKLKRSIKHKDSLYILCALEPLAADYGIRNQYLQSYNRLTDGLALKPVLLYNSESTARSQEVFVTNLTVVREFSISAIFEKARYQEFLTNRIHQLHWWLEFLALIFFVFTNAFLTFEFIGFCGSSVSRSRLVLGWLVFLGISILSATTAASFSSFGIESLLSPGDFSLQGYWSLFRSPGNLLITAFFTLNLLFSLVLLSRGIHAGIPWRKGPWNYLLLLAAFFGGAVLLGWYFQFLRRLMESSSFNLINFSMQGMSPPRLSLIFGVAWLDLAMLLLLGVGFAFFSRKMPRGRNAFGLWIVLQAAVVVVVLRLLPSTPVLPFAVLYIGLGVLIYSLPNAWTWFERINALSRFIALLLLVSATGFLCYLVRFQHAVQLQGDFMRNVAALEVTRQEVNVKEMLRISTEQLDQALESITIDPRIPDLPYRLWLRTEFARRGYKSAVELYDSEGIRQNGFSLRLVSLRNLNVVRLAPPDSRWVTIPLDVPFGSVRRQIQVSVRRLENGGFIAAEAMEDIENLPFIPSTSPLQDLFRPQRSAGRYVELLALCVYDGSWHPTFVSDSDMVPTVDRAREMLQSRREFQEDQTIEGRPVRILFFPHKRGAAALVVPRVSLRAHFVQWVDLLLLNLFWLGILSILLYSFFYRHVALHFPRETTIRISFFQKLLFAFLVFSMVPMLFLSYLIRNYVWEKKTSEVTSRALYTFSVASRVISDYLFSQGDVSRREIFGDDTLEWIGQVSQQDVSVYFENMLIGTSVRDLYTAELLPQRLPGTAYVDLFLKGKKYSIGPSRLGLLEYLNVSGRVHRGRFKDEVITIPFLIDRRSVEEEIVGLREFMMLAGAALILFAVAIGWFMARRFVSPVRVLIAGTAEMARGNLRYRIPRRYRDEFQQLVSAFNTMANSLDEQQQALERRREYIENILNNITTAVISVDNTTTIATVNPAAARILGAEGLVGRPLGEAIDDSTWPELASTVREFLADPQTFHTGEVAEFRTSSELHLRLVYVPLFQNQTWTGAALLVEDVSDIIQSNRLSAFAEMARQVAHEVKNPLTPIQLAVEHLVRVYEDRSPDFSSVLKSCSEAVLKQVKALRRLVSDFSQFGRPAMLNRVDANVQALVEDIVRSYQSHLPPGIRMETQVDPDVPRVRIDSEKIRGALMNIMENGLQAMNGSGRITIRVSKEGSQVRIAVQDTGSGVPPDILPRMFEPYFSTKSGGTGLGLAIARKNVEDHGGRIEAVSVPGLGTTINITLPTD